jgi:two-component system sensor histidine kinase UhpB
MQARGHALLLRLRGWLRGLSVFEKVIVANSVIISLGTLFGWWVTQHDPETYHYLIDTAFITLAVLVGLAINFMLLRAAFAPLREVMTTIRAVERGDLEARAAVSPLDADAEALARAFNGMLDQLNRQRDETAGRVLQAQEQERRRLALELHDQTGQSLTALSLHISAVAARLDGATSEAARQARTQLEQLNAVAESTLYEVQQLAKQLRPPLLDDLGLVAALRWLAQDGSDRLGTKVSMRLSGSVARGAPAANSAAPRLPAPIETALFRIAQESLTNAVRHGHASRVAVLLRQTPTYVSLLVADDGDGFSVLPHQERFAGGGTGLDGMAERARLLGGHLAIRSRPGGGCAVRVSVPIEREPDAAQSSESEAARAPNAAPQALTR